jgi:hypothetical protein
MKKLLFITACGATLMVAASPKATLSAASCLWKEISGTLLPDDGRQFSISSDGRVQVQDSAGGPSYGTAFLSESHSGGKSALYLASADSPSYNAWSDFGWSVNSPSGIPISQMYASTYDGVNSLEAQIDLLSNLNYVGFELKRNGSAVFSATPDGVTAGGTEAWKLGSVIPATVQLVTDKYVQVEIGGQIVKLAVVE